MSEQISMWFSFIKRSLALVLWLGAAGAVYAQNSFFDYEFNTTQGKKQSMQAYQGRPMVINFWASWCPPCVKEMPDLEALSQQYPHIQFVGVAIDTQRNVNRFLTEKLQVSYDIYVAGHSGVQVMRDLGNQAGGVPFTLVLDNNGQVVEQLLGQINKHDLAQRLAQLPTETTP